MLHPTPTRVNGTCNLSQLPNHSTLLVASKYIPFRVVPHVVPCAAILVATLVATRAVPRAVPRAIPRIAPRIVPRIVLHITQRAVLRAVPGTVLHITLRAVPHTHAHAHTPTLTFVLWSKPSIWLSSSSRMRCTSRSAPVCASNRLVAMASISSMKMTLGEFSLASRNTSRTMRGPSPRYFCTNSDPTWMARLGLRVI